MTSLATSQTQVPSWYRGLLSPMTTHYPRTLTSGPPILKAWNLIKDQIILAEKCSGRATLAHNSPCRATPRSELGTDKDPLPNVAPIAQRGIFHPHPPPSTGETLIHGGGAPRQGWPLWKSGHHPHGNNDEMLSFWGKQAPVPPAEKL